MNRPARFFAAAVLALAAPSAFAGDASKEMPLTSKSKEALALLTQGRDLIEHSRVAEAEPILKKALTLDPDFAVAHAYLAQILPPKESAGECAMATKLAASLGEPERLYVDSVCAAMLGDIAKGRDAEQKLLLALPNDWRAHDVVGMRAFNNHDTDGAIVHLKKATELNPKDGNAFNMLGYAYLDQHKATESVAAFQKYVDVAPTNPNARDSLGDALMYAGKLPEAEASFAKAVEVDPKFFGAYSGVALSKARRGDWKGAVDAMTKAVAAAPRPIDKPAATIELGFWQLFAGNGADGEKSVLAGEKAAQEQKLDADYAFAALDHARFLRMSGKPRDALKLVDEAQARAAKATLPAGTAIAFKRDVLQERLDDQALGNDATGAKKTASDLEAHLLTTPDEPFRASMLHAVKGDVAAAAGDWKTATAEYKQCFVFAAPCLAKGVVAAEKAGDKASADAMKKTLTDNVNRNSVVVHAWLTAKLFAAGAGK